uniref:DDHD domain-containing protein n=1 Tax=Macrostomum lignano TaxID=282301 RepID=A0A1I8FNN1_9PLAT
TTSLAAGLEGQQHRVDQRRRGSFDDEESPASGRQHHADCFSPRRLVHAARVAEFCSWCCMAAACCDTNHEYHNKHDPLTLHTDGPPMNALVWPATTGVWAVRRFACPTSLSVRLWWPMALQALTTGACRPYQYRPYSAAGAASQADASLTAEYASTWQRFAGADDGCWVNERSAIRVSGSPEGRGFNGQRLSASLATAQAAFVGYRRADRVPPVPQKPTASTAAASSATRRVASRCHKLDSAPDRLEFRLKPPTPPSASASASARPSLPALMAANTRLEFDVSDLFLLGCPLALVLAYRRVNSQKDKCVHSDLKPKLQSDQTNSACQQACQRICSRPLFRLDQPAARCTTCSTPAIPARFAWSPPASRPVPLAGAPCAAAPSTACCRAAMASRSVSAGGRHQSCGDVFLSGGWWRRRRRRLQWPLRCSCLDRIRTVPVQQQFGIVASGCLFRACAAAGGRPKRLDYSLHCPDTLSRVLHQPPCRLLFHAATGRAPDAAAFILRQFVDAVPQCGAEPSLPTIVIVAEGQAQVLTARFMYGPFDMLSLSDEVIDVHVMSQPPSSGEWSYVGSCNTDSHGKAVFTVPAERRLAQGVPRATIQSADLNLAVLPPATECVVFSVDGSFAASVSINGRRSKSSPGAVDVVRHWQDLGYLLVYISARPDMQPAGGWLAGWPSTNFPHGMKTACLTKLAGQAGLLIHAAYGSSKDIAVYQSLNLRRGQIFIHWQGCQRKHAGNAT